MPKATPKAQDLAPAKPLVTSLVKKDLKQLKDYAAAVQKAIKSPSAAALRICECCIRID